MFASVHGGTIVLIKGTKFFNLRTYKFDAKVKDCTKFQNTYVAFKTVEDWCKDNKTTVAKADIGIMQIII